jgi:hypothetical protein
MGEKPRGLGFEARRIKKANQTVFKRLLFSVTTMVALKMTIFDIQTLFLHNQFSTLLDSVQPVSIRATLILNH